MDMLVVQAARHEAAVGREHEAAELGVDGDVAHARGDEYLIVDPVHSLAYILDVVFVLVRTVGHADAAGEVDESDMSAGLLLELDREAEQLHGKRRIIVVCRGV